MNSRAAAALVALFAVTSAQAASPAFGPPRPALSLVPPAMMTELAAADFNGDGREDVFLTRLAWPFSTAAFPVTVLLNQRDGRFVDATAEVFAGPVPQTVHARRLLVDDFNGDRRPDVFIADSGFDGPPWPGAQNKLVLSTGDGRLVDASSNLPAGLDSDHGADAADVDRDGDVDIFVNVPCCGDGTTSQLLLNDGTGRFSVDSGALPSVLTDFSLARYGWPHFADVDRDGAPELVLGGDFSGTPTTVFRNDGSGRFGVGSDLPPKPFGPTANCVEVTSADLTGDRWVDLLVGCTRQEPFYRGRMIQVLVNQRDGTFRDESAQRLPQSGEGDWATQISVVDLDRDGDLDIAARTGSFGGTASPPVYLNRGNGTFRRAASLIPSLRPVFTFLDANSDGNLDVFTSVPAFQDRTTESHAVILQIRPPAAPTAVAATRNLKDRIRLTWRAAAGATRYEVTRDGKRVGTTFGTRYDDRSARPGVRHAYAVRARNAAGTSALSTVVIGIRRAPA